MCYLGQSKSDELSGQPSHQGATNMWLKNCWQVAAFASEIGEHPCARRLLGGAVLLFRLSSGKAVALQDQCPHRLLPLSHGQRIGDEIQCAYHGLKFAGDGRCTHIPGQAIIPENSRAITYPLVERNGLAWIWLGTKDLADEMLVPDFPWMEPAHWRQSSGYHHFECDYRLITDNLLDLSHENYVHKRSIGNGAEEDIAKYPVTVTSEQGTIIRAHREMLNIEPPPFFELILNTKKRIDRWQTAIYMPPGINMTEAGAYIAGTSRADAAVNRIMHLLTPETATSSHYFWCVSRNYRLDDTALDTAIGQSVASTFDEDKTILALQQVVISDTQPNALPRFATTLDEAPIRARRIVDRWMRENSKNDAFVAPVMPLVPDESRTPAMQAAPERFSIFV